MYGAILGDIAGSKIEFSRPDGFNYKKAVLFTPSNKYTDDTVLTVATKYAILNNTTYAKAYGLFGRRYRAAGYGDMFQKWLDNMSTRGYGSFGNGAAMRVSFIGEYFKTLEQVEREAEISAFCTHSHEYGIEAAKATAAMVYLAKNQFSKKEIVTYINKNYSYKTNIPLIFRRPFGKFDASAMGTMPLAIRCFLESDSWEDCIRNVFSVKCDTDTVACIAGGIAENFFGKTGMDDKALLKQYLIMPGKFDKFDTFLYDWAIKDYEKR